MLNYYKYDVHFWVRQVVSCIHIKASVPICVPVIHHKIAMAGCVCYWLERTCCLACASCVSNEFDDRERCMGIDVNRVIQGVSYYSLVSEYFQTIEFITTGEISTIFFRYNCFTSGWIRLRHAWLAWNMDRILSKYYNGWEFKLLIIQFLYYIIIMINFPTNSVAILLKERQSHNSIYIFLFNFFLCNRNICKNFNMR